MKYSKNLKYQNSLEKCLLSLKYAYFVRFAFVWLPGWLAGWLGWLGCLFISLYLSRFCTLFSLSCNAIALLLSYVCFSQARVYANALTMQRCRFLLTLYAQYNFLLFYFALLCFVWFGTFIARSLSLSLHLFLFLRLLVMFWLILTNEIYLYINKYIVSGECVCITFRLRMRKMYHLFIISNDRFNDNCNIRHIFLRFFLSFFVKNSN